jgi:alkanesulfonate monooxygenase SsuD/methylene tetrahydromethanopterin reductase-like flavin-dependent oxidoreductase (luciferase family)
MKLGLGPIRLDGMTRVQLELLAEAAVEASFDSVWVAESRADGVGGGLAAAALLAQVVPIRVGALVDAGVYHPLHMAEDIAIADLTSQGRLEVILRGGPFEHLQVLVAALSGAHIRFDGRDLHVPARLDANQPVPERLALNPRPAQPVVPIWVLEREGAVARDLGLGLAAVWSAGARVPPATGRVPGMLLCQASADPGDLLRAAGDSAGYFLVGAETPRDVASSGRRLVGPLRMPGFPEWINAQ